MIDSDSAIAGAAHQVELWNAAAGSTPPETDALAEYAAIPGFEPAEEGQ